MRLLAPRVQAIALVVIVIGVLATLREDSVQAGGMTFTVNTELDGAPSECTAEVDGCTLRDAIFAVNNNPGNDTINFAPGPYYILPGDPFPPIDATQGITIDGGGSVQIVGAIAVTGSGLVFETGIGEELHDVTVRGVEVTGWPETAIKVCAGASGSDCTFNAFDVSIEDVIVNENGGDGISIKGANVAGVTLERIYATLNGGDAMVVQAAISVTDVTVSGAEVREQMTPLSDALRVSGQVVADVSFLDSIVERTWGGVAMTGSGVDAAIMRALASGNELIESGNEGSSQLFIYAEVITDALVEGNEVRDGPGKGISVHSPGCIPEDCPSGGEIIGNVVTGNGRAGIQFGGMSEMTVEDNVSEGNLIGILAESPGLGAGNLVTRNTITGNTSDGVAVQGFFEGSVRISRNATFGNGQLGIDLESFLTPEAPPGVTPNDPGDVDTGPNEFLNYPVLTGVEASGMGGQFVSGTACANCLVELFLSDGDPSGHGEGQQFVADAEADGAGEFNVPICGENLNAGTVVTATATDSGGNTSEFSANYSLPVGSGDCPTPSPSPPTPQPTETAAPTVTATPTGAPTATPTTAPSETPGPKGLAGDMDCDGDVDAVDALALLRHVAGLPPLAQQEPCPDVGSAGAAFGDLDCDGDIDAVDALAVLRFVAGLSPLAQQEPCTDVGT